MATSWIESRGQALPERSDDSHREFLRACDDDLPVLSMFGETSGLGIGFRKPALISCEIHCLFPDATGTVPVPTRSAGQSASGRNEIRL